jgi:hypothetical protein
VVGRVALVGAALALFASPAAVAFNAGNRAVAFGDTITGAQARPGALQDAPTQSSTGRPRRATAGGTVGPAVDAQIGTELANQAAALLAGDAGGFVGPADPADNALRADLARRFAALRALRVAVWQEAATGPPVATANGGWSVPVQLTYCFASPDCTPLTVTVQTAWRLAGGRAVLVAFGVSPGTELGPRPWEVSDLRTAVGARVVLATTPRYAGRLPGMLAAAERAAAVADRYAKWGGPPVRYLVFLAGPDEWTTWYGVKQASWVAAYAMPLTEQVTEVVLNASRVDVAQTADVLRHELTHAVTLVGTRQAYDHTWWLVEGVAEYVRLVGGKSAFDGAVDLRRFVHSGHWAGTVALDDPVAGATDAEVRGEYGVAFLAVRRIAERFGEPRMLDFFGAVVRDGVALEQAAPATLGVSWDDVAVDCAQYVRRAAG